MKGTKVISHRGLCQGQVENSIDGFRHAASIGADMVEMDARTTLDGQVVIMHDRTVDRTADGSGAVCDLTADEIRLMRLGDGSPVPSLAEALAALGGKCGAIIEFKDGRAGAISSEIVSEMELDVTFSSSRPEWLRPVLSVLPDARIALVSDKRGGRLRTALRIGAREVHLSSKTASESVIRKAHDLDLDVFVWTVNGIPEMERFIRLGADGIITDKPEVLLGILRRRAPQV